MPTTTAATLPPARFRPHPRARLGRTARGVEPAGRTGARRAGGDRRDLPALAGDRGSARRDLVERRAGGLAVRAGLDAARGGLRRGAGVRLPDDRPLVRLSADARARAGANPARVGAAAR